MYSIADYGAMIADRVRLEAFARALELAVRPGAVVIDIGTGTGIFALLACRLGARRVYAIEPDDAIQVAREVAAANGYADRIAFIQARSIDVTLPEPGDVIVADIGGVLPWFEQHLPAIADARRRLLAPGGAIIPRRDTVWAAVVEAPEVYARHTGPWDDGPLGFDMQAARRLVVNTWNKARVTPEQLLAGPTRWATIDYATVEDPDIQAEVTWEVGRRGTGHGFAAGFDREVAEGVTLSNAPDAPATVRPERIYGTLFFPWERPVELAPGDLVRVELDARLVGGDYVWSWRTRVDGREPRRGKAAFVQSTFFGVPLAPARLRTRSASYTPVLNEEGRLARLVLNSMAEGVPLGEIARRAAAAFPARFPRPQDALDPVAELSRKYG